MRADDDAQRPGEDVLAAYRKAEMERALEDLTAAMLRWYFEQHPEELTLVHRA